MSVAVLVKTPPRLVVAKAAIATHVVLFARMAAMGENYSSGIQTIQRLDKMTNLRLCPQAGAHAV